jgi:WD40 repeat protein
MRDADRRQLLYLDAVRRGAADASRQFASADPGAALWRVDWASGTDLDPRLRLKLHVGPVRTVAWGVVHQRPLIAACTREPAEDGSGARYRLRVWDALSGQSRELPCTEPARCLSFAVTADGAVLVSGHDGGWLRIWNVADSSLRTTVDIGDDHVLDLYVAESGDRAQAVTIDAQWRVHRWSLPTGEKLGVLDTSRTYSMCGGRLVDGRQVLLTAGDGLSAWDLDGGGRLGLRVPREAQRVRSVVLGTAGGRDCVTVVDERHAVVTFDLATGVQPSAPVTAHVNLRPDGLMRMWSDPRPHAKLAVVSGTLAVPTPWRVHLWDLDTSQPRYPPIAGPVARCEVQAVRWQDRELLLTASAYDGVVALWDLDLPVVREPGHDQRVSRVALTEPAEVAVSVDEGGTIVARHGIGGQLLADPLATGIESTHALAAWRDGDSVIAATGAGSRYVTDGNLRRWNVTTGRPYGPRIPAHLTYLHWLSRVLLHGRQALVTFGPGGMLKIWRPADGALIAETPTGVRSKVTGFATGVIDGRPYAALSSYGQPMTLHPLDDLTAPPTIVPEAGDDIVLAIAGPQILAAHFDDERTRANTLRVWNASGDRLGPAVRTGAAVTSAAVRSWPAVYVGRADGTVSLTDVAEGRDLCAPLLLPARPSALAVMNNGDLVVAFGSDVARVRPPVAASLPPAAEPGAGPVGWPSDKAR